MRTVTYDETQWKLVPIEPTDEMIKAGQNTICVTTDDDDADSINDYKSVYRSMIKAAPPYPDQSVEVTDMVWIPVSQRLPDHRNSVLCYTVWNGGASYIKQERLNPAKTKFYVEYEGDEPCEKITHWMPLPAAPKGEE